MSIRQGVQMIEDVGLKVMTNEYGVHQGAG
jgi:hypothetical protein